MMQFALCVELTELKIISDAVLMKVGLVDETVTERRFLIRPPYIGGLNISAYKRLGSCLTRVVKLSL